MEAFLKANQIDTIYRYAEVRDGINTVFGWQHADDLDISKPIILSYYSRSKFATKEDRRIGREEGISAATKEDYEKFFIGLVGSTSGDFFRIWRGKSLDDIHAALSASMVSKNPNQTDFLFKLARLLVTGKKFNIFARGYRLISPEVENAEPDPE